MSVSQIMMTSADVSNYDLGTRTTTSLATRRIPLQKDQNSSSFSKAKLSKRSLKSRQEQMGLGVGFAVDNQQRKTTISRA